MNEINIGRRKFVLLIGTCVFVTGLTLLLHEYGSCKGEASQMQKPNHLIHEKSPYLLQHAYNPVDWYPWDEAAFEKARREKKPILVSIGYSTCHWCHVMERESYAHPEIAAVMNKVLVSIKVDREERPDIDKIYMTAVTAMTGSGGWPLNVFLTPDLKPFFGGTYFPPEDRWGRIGWKKLVERIGQAWQDPQERKKIIDSSENLTQQLEGYLSGQSEQARPDLALLKDGFNAFRLDYDTTFGGFGGAPKFPMPVNHNFLLRYYAYAKDKKDESAEAQKAREISLATLRAMAKGGIYDQIGGGFHRYSTDERWHVPHFEKMLYDNAQLAINYLDAYQVSREKIFAQTAEEILQYILRDMTHPEGGFYSAEDADSLPPELAAKVSEPGDEHKAEGAFYVWEKKEILKILGTEQGEIFSFHYGVEENGNTLSDPQSEFKNKNILYLGHSLSETAQKFRKSEKEIGRFLEESKMKLFEARAQRPRPHRDDKILTSWNGLAISAFARAHQILGKEKYLKAAEAAAHFIQTHLYEADNRQLYRRWREGEKKVKGIADDYAFLTQGLLDLYESGFKTQWLDWAMELAEETRKRFYDSQRGGFYMTELIHAKDLLLRVKEDSDNVEPSASSVATLNFLRLAQFTDRADFRNAAEKTLQLYTPQMKTQPRSLPQMLVALNFALTKPYQIILAGEISSADTQILLEEVNSRFIPNKILMVLGDPASRSALVKHLSFLENLLPIKNKATAYVCINYACRLPTNDLNLLKQILDGKN